MSNIQRTAVPVTSHAEDELLTIQEVADLVRVPVATLRYWRHLGTGPRASALAAASATGARKSSPGSTNRPIATARMSTDIAEPRGSRRGVLRREHEQERAWPGTATT